LHIAVVGVVTFGCLGSTANSVSDPVSHSLRILKVTVRIFRVARWQHTCAIEPRIVCSILVGPGLTSMHYTVCMSF